MINHDSVETFKNDTLAMAFASIESSERYAKCGKGKGRGFKFQDGDVVKFPDLNQLFIKVTTTTMNKENYDLLSVGCEVNGKATWVPVWALRKSVAQDKEPVALSNMDFYQELLLADNDIERIKMLMGCTVKIVKFTVKLIDSKTKVEFSKEIFAARVLERPATENKPKKSSKKSSKKAEVSAE